MPEQIDELPKFRTLFWPVVTTLRQLGGSADNDQIVEKVAEFLALPDRLTAVPHKAGPQTAFGYRIAWVKTWLKWGQMMDNPQRGVWVLTELGRTAGEEEVNDVFIQKRAEEAKRAKSAKPKKTDAEVGSLEQVESITPTDELDEYADDNWQNELLDVIKEMKPPAFERLSRRLLLALGFQNVEVVGRSGDGGIDLLGIVKVNNVISFHVLAQCKRYKETVGPGDIRNFRGAMQGRTDKGIFITSGRYTSEAKKEASRDGVPAIDLVDGEALTILLKNNRLGVETKMVEQVVVQKTFFDEV